jgi:uncharacterized protein YqgV (UPF0045/DUF77 family)
MAKEIISCEMSFIPIASQNYIEDVENVLKVISQSGLEYQTNSFSTILTGTKEEILALIGEIIEKMYDNSKFTIVLKLSNICGCNR